MPRKKYLSSVKRIVVKIGSSSLTEGGVISESKILVLVSQLTALRDRGYELVLVSSGAITAGAGLLQKDVKALSIPQKQAMAAVGQTILMSRYRLFFKEKGYDVGQILMTEDDVKNRRRFLNVRNTMNTLLKMGIVPIVNENDSVVVKEIKVGDNDTLSCHVANMVEADLLILLSDIDGLYRDLSDPAPIDTVNAIDDEIRSYAGDSGSKYGTGGMHTKLNAADVMIRSGEMMVIANAKDDHVLADIMDGKRTGTLFVSSEEGILSGRKRWIAFNMKVRGTLKVDKGASAALCDQKSSLLPIGVTGWEGEFEVGDALNIAHDGKVIAKGIVNYSSKELGKVMGLKSEKVHEMMGDEFYEEVIHRDNLIVY
jgi:glutamate 5-kinase